jgi:hypothetical protein
MTGPLKKVVASVYRSGKGGPLSKVEFVGILSYNLRFFDPAKAGKLHKVAVGTGLLRPQGQNMYVPTFPADTIEIEPDYRPDPGMDLDSFNRSLSERLIDAVCGSGLERRDAIKNINRMAESLNLLFPAAAIYVGIEEGRDMSGFYTEVESVLLAPSR